MLVKDMQPIATVERSGIKKLFQRLLPNVDLPSRRTLARNIDDMYDRNKQQLIQELKHSDYISTTADIWSSHKRSFIGITAHYIDKSTLKRVSHVLTCQRFKHSHIGDKIAAEIANVFDEFRITSKVTSCVTDNASNMVKALTLLDSACTRMSTYDSVDAESYDRESETSEGTEEVQLISLSDILQDETNDDDCELLDMLRKHIRCANHTLNLVADVDCKSARTDEKYKRVYDRVMGKVQALRNAVSRSTKHADVVEEIAGLTFLNPTCTRWSSEYMAVDRLVQISIEKVRQCQQQIGLACITEAEMTFLKSYVTAMKPVAIAMDLLQGDEACFIGHVIPTVIGINRS